MSISKVKTYTNHGLDGHEIVIEIDTSRSLPTIEIIWLPDNAIKESKERLKSTFRQCWVDLPKKKIIVNLAPSHIRKVGTWFDLPIAVGILSMTHEGNHQYADQLLDFLFFGELWLDGLVKRVNGILPAIIAAMKHGYRHFVIPSDNLYECEYIQGITLYPIVHFQEIVDAWRGWVRLRSITDAKSVDDLVAHQPSFEVDFSQIKWHLFAKRALTIAAAGLHNVCMVWAPGSGKTLLSRALQTILPPLGFAEMLEVSQIYSLVGKLDKHTPLITHRPFRPVHHTASKVSIIWWWALLHPGEISLANKGILFFDELPEFPREVLEVLRQPLEDKMITISRASGTVTYPANVMFVSTMNPCKCGFYKDAQKPCVCSLHDVKKYQSKISWPLLDRIDMILEIPRESIDTLLDQVGTDTSADLRAKVISTRHIQQARLASRGIAANAHISSRDIDALIILDSGAKDFLRKAANMFQLSGRVIHRAMKLARTIADLEWADIVWLPHIAEALQYRSKTMFVEG